MPERILVTGGAGFIGSHLVDRLVANGHAVTIIDDFSSGERSNLSEAETAGNVKLIEGSINDNEALAKAIEGCAVVYHMAVQGVRRSLGEPLENHDVNATGTLKVLEAARQRKVEQFVYCSSSEVYGNVGDSRLNEQTTQCEPVTVYGAAKLAGEHYTKAYYRTYGLHTVIVRPFNTFGPRAHERGGLAEVIPRFAIRILNGKPPVIFGSGENGRDFTYVTDTIRGLTLAANCRELIGREVNIAKGKMLTIAEVAEAVARLCQRPDLAPVYECERPGDVRHLNADVSLAREVMGFESEIEFERGLKMYLEWFSQAHPNPADLLEDDIVNWQMPE